MCSSALQCLSHMFLGRLDSRVLPTFIPQVLNMWHCPSRIHTLTLLFWSSNALMGFETLIKVEDRLSCSEGLGGGRTWARTDGWKSLSTRGAQINHRTGPRSVSEVPVKRCLCPRSHRRYLPSPWGAALSLIWGFDQLMYVDTDSDLWGNYGKNVSLSIPRAAGLLCGLRTPTDAPRVHGDTMETVQHVSVLALKCTWRDCVCVCARSPALIDGEHICL